MRRRDVVRDVWIGGGGAAAAAVNEDVIGEESAGCDGADFRLAVKGVEAEVAFII